jgi:hypothetical protein
VTLSPTTQYWLGWIAMGVVFLVCVRVFLVNPLLRESEKVRAEINSLRSGGGGS